MTKDDLIRMADLVGYDVDDDDDVHAPASGRYGLDPRLEHFAELVAGYALRYERPDMSKKTQNVDTSEECVHENDKSIHQPWDTTDMAHRSGGLTVDVTDLIERAKAEEREACAKLCEQEHDNYLRDKEPDRADGAMWCATAIRGRSE
jgi:hypothetical protein